MDNSFGVIQFPRIIPQPSTLIHQEAQKELIELYKRSGQSVALAAQFKKRLQFLEKHLKLSCSMASDWFEKLEPTTNQLYAIRFNRVKNLGNLRIIYDFSGDSPRLLAAFQEHNKADYAPAIAIALNRRNDS